MRRVLVSMLALLLAVSLKLAYSRASATELEWILGPSCWLASLAGVPLEHERGAGWISHATHMIVGPACAGVNFLVVCWLALFFARQGAASGTWRKLRWLAASGCIAYAAAALTNGLRIVLAAQLYGHAIAFGWLTPERLHRLLGVVLYCSVLFTLCRTVEGRASRITAFAWYLGVVLVIPLLNSAFSEHPAAFVEHAAFTLGAGLLVLLVFGLGGRTSGGGTRLQASTLSSGARRRTRFEVESVGRSWLSSPHETESVDRRG